MFNAYIYNIKYNNNNYNKTNITLYIINKSIM